jgi:hypothetical protein
LIQDTRKRAAALPLKMTIYLPTSAKTLFLLGILECRKGVYFDGSNTTNRILDVLEEKRPKIICIDELDKMPKQFQDKLLNFMESGHIKVDQMRKHYDFKIKGAKVFAACKTLLSDLMDNRRKLGSYLMDRYCPSEVLHPRILSRNFYNYHQFVQEACQSDH